MTTKQQAVRQALQAEPMKFHAAIARQLGCSTSLVSKVAAQLTAEQGGLTGAKRRFAQQRAAIQQALQHGLQDTEAIAAAAQASPRLVAMVRAELRTEPRLDRTPLGRQRRLEVMRTMAAQGYSSRQIAAQVGLQLDGCRRVLQRAGIDVSAADRAVFSTRRQHDPNRIVAEMVLDAEHLTADVHLIDFAALDAAQRAPWVASLRASRRALSAFIHRLSQGVAYEQQAADEGDAASLEDSAGAHRRDAHSASPAHTTALSESAWGSAGRRAGSE